jgi:Zn-dependent M16 (insulinase) family peptidase
MEERLAWLDENYLSRFEKIDFDTTVKAQKPFGGLRRAEGFYPIGKEGKE